MGGADKKSSATVSAGFRLELKAGLTLWLWLGVYAVAHLNDADAVGEVALGFCDGRLDRRLRGL